MTLLETLRLYPPVPHLVREPVVDDQIVSRRGPGALLNRLLHRGRLQSSTAPFGSRLSTASRIRGKPTPLRTRSPAATAGGQPNLSQILLSHHRGAVHALEAQHRFKSACNRIRLFQIPIPQTSVGDFCNTIGQLRTYSTRDEAPPHGGRARTAEKQYSHAAHAGFELLPFLRRSGGQEPERRTGRRPFLEQSPISHSRCRGCSRKDKREDAGRPRRSRAKSVGLPHHIPPLLRVSMDRLSTFQ
jgi:hypothetical protein